MLAAASGCGGEDEAGPAPLAPVADAGPPDGGPPGPVVDLVVDANRDGWVKYDDPADQDHEDEWTAEFGASFLANLDDDDQDGVRDNEDGVVNGDADVFDLARMLIIGWPEVPEGAKGTLSIDEASVPHVHVFKREGDGSWKLVLGSLGPCGIGGDKTCELTSAKLELDAAVLATGAELGIEAKRFKGTVDAGDWSGMVELELGVVDGKEKPVGKDSVKMRVAPWIAFGNLSLHDTVFSSTISSEFVNGLKVPIQDAGLTYRKIKMGEWPDHWTQDIFETGYTAIPWEGGKVQGMRVAMPRPWGRSEGAEALPRAWLADHYLGPDTGWFEPCERKDSEDGPKCPIDDEAHQGVHYGSTFDSFGDHDLLPPYEKDGESYPLGRIITGSADYVMPETIAFYEAQGVQSPVTAKTIWLAVGHIDEVFSYVPAKTARGWKLLVASPKLMREMMEDLQAKGHGDVQMFVGRKVYGPDNKLVDAAVSIDAVLASEDLAKANQISQAEIDDMLATLVDLTGVTPDEIVEIPFLYEEVYEGAMLAFNPGTVNSLVFGDYFVAPKHFGPIIDGKDAFDVDLKQRLATPQNALGSDGQGMKVYAVDNWYGYHILMGEVHCATNWQGPPATAAWWEVEP
ncbi:MAG: hypothetical protein HY744_13390 [Deltaproteobacteria bacterium]|nr:hypothetical protein [Deltaproteobacteria bacterium]